MSTPAGMVMIKSPGRQILLREMRDYLFDRTGKRFLLVSCAATLLSVVWLLLEGSRLSAYFAGVFTLMLPSLVTYLVIVQGEFASRLAGADAETRTYNLLRRRVGTGIWAVEPHLRFSGYDVDMVVVTPRAVLAMEVKWHGRATPQKKIASSAAQCRSRAVAVETLLRRHGVSEAVRVVPVLAVWGPAADAIPDGVKRHGDVTVVDAELPDTWLGLLGTGRISQDSAERISAILQAHASDPDFAERRELKTSATR